MSAENLDIPIAYEQLEDIEDDFEEAELELLRLQNKLTESLYVKREKVISQIPNFWPLVFEQSPADIDEYIQPSDAALLLGSIKSLSVERFELPQGHPRSIAIKFEFNENEFFENTVLEKKFWWRRAKDGWAGLVSEPVDIKWKADKDLTGGLLALARKVWEEEQAGKTEETEAKKELKERMAKTGMGGVSFFAWFGFRGRNITPEEDREAAKEEQERRQARKEGKEVEVKDEDEEDEGDDDEYELEIFPTADDLAVAIAEDLWPGAIKYFTEAQEQDDLSDVGFESDDDEEMEEPDGEDNPPQKKRKAPSYTRPRTRSFDECRPGRCNVGKRSRADDIEASLLSGGNEVQAVLWTTAASDAHDVTRVASGVIGHPRASRRDWDRSAICQHCTHCTSGVAHAFACASTASRKSVCRSAAGRIRGAGPDGSVAAGRRKRRRASNLRLMRLPPAVLRSAHSTITAPAPRRQQRQTRCSSVRAAARASMATAYQIHVPARDTGLLGVEQDEAAAAKVTELLQKDLENHHVFFNAEGFHNHILHQLLALYGTGAAPALLQQAYDANKTYQIAAMEPHSAVVDELQHDWAASAPKYLGKGRHYPDFLAFFQREVARKGWQAVLAERVFDLDAPGSAALRGRLYAGFLHPMIQLMYGVEWEQPAVVAEGLAQAAVHDGRLGEFLAKVDRAAADAPAAEP
ncbi:Putative nucleosome assembly protein C36B7.08c, partial [Tolypocladium paradoxum]